MVCLRYMTTHKFKIQLSKDDEEHIQNIIRKGKHNGRITRARILLFSSSGEWKDQIASRLAIDRCMAQRTRDLYRKGGLDYALTENPRSGAPRKLNDDAEAHLNALACSDPPEEYGKWTLDLMK